MKQFKGTSGPWVSVDGEVTTEDYAINGVIYADHICNCEVVDGVSHNANLIAAAPDLLDSLQSCEEFLSGMESLGFAGLALVEHARVVIAKALGEQ